MKKKKIIIMMLVVIGIILTVIAMSGCVQKERYNWDEDGPGKDTYYEPVISDGTPGFELPLLLISFVGLYIWKKKRYEK